MGVKRGCYWHCFVWYLKGFEENRKGFGVLKFLLEKREWMGVVTLAGGWCRMRIFSQRGLIFHCYPGSPSYKSQCFVNALLTTMVGKQSCCVLPRNKPALNRPLTRSRRQTRSNWEGLVWGETIRGPCGLSWSWRLTREGEALKTVPKWIKAVRSAEEIAKALTEKMAHGTARSISTEAVRVVKHNIASKNCGINKNYSSLNSLLHISGTRIGCKMPSMHGSHWLRY